MGIDKHLIYKEYASTIDSIIKYQNQQVDLRMIAAKILLGTIALDGGLLFAKVEITSHQLFILCSSIPFFSLFIVSVILVTDLYYKEKLRHSFYIEAMSLEMEYKWLPEFNTILNKKSRLPANGQIIYYFGCVAILMLLSAIPISLYTVEYHFYMKIVAWGAYLAAYLLYCYYFVLLIRESSCLDEKIE